MDGYGSPSAWYTKPTIAMQSKFHAQSHRRNLPVASERSLLCNRKDNQAVEWNMASGSFHNVFRPENLPLSLCAPPLQNMIGND